GINYSKLGKPQLKKPTWILGSLVFSALLIAFILLPPNYDGLVMTLQIGVAVSIAAIQYPLFYKVREQNPSFKTTSILKPALLSILFLIIPIGAILVRNEYLFKKELRLLKLSKELFQTSQYRKSIQTLKEGRETNPGQQLF